MPLRHDTLVDDGRYVLTRRYRRDTNDPDEMPVVVKVARGRRFFIDLPDDLPMDEKDSDAVNNELSALVPKPDAIDGPVPSGLGDLVYSGWVVEFWDDKRTDDDIMLDLEDAVRAGLRNRAWLVQSRHALKGKQLKAAASPVLES